MLGSALLLLALSPILAAIALAIKLTSKGPVIFEQERLGQFGAKFKCLKFRTMYTNNDPKIHREYVQSFIAGQAKVADSNGNATVVYKLTNDPRVTAVGHSCERPVSMNFRSSGMFCAGRVDWWGRDLQLPMSLRCMTIGTGAAFLS